MLKERSEVIDFIKGVAIILVVYGHAIQYTSGDNYLTNGLFFDNIVFKWIYSFHMPLFMLVSGFLFKNYENKNLKEKILDRTKKLIYPIVAWQTLWSLRYIFIDSNDIFLIFYIKELIYGLWFLWAIFYSSLVIIVVEKICKYERGRVLIYFLGVIISIVLPDYLGSSVYKYMYPFFIIGYYNKNFLERLKNFKRIQIIYIIFLLVLYLLLFKYFNYNSYIYTSGYSILKNGNINLYQITIDVYRFAIGLVGSILVITLSYLFFLVDKFFYLKNIKYLGKETLGIYIITGYIYSIIIKFYFIKNLNLNYLKAFLYSLIFMLISLIIVRIIKKIKILNIILLGNRR